MLLPLFTADNGMSTVQSPGQPDDYKNCGDYTKTSVQVGRGLIPGIIVIQIHHIFAEEIQSDNEDGHTPVQEDCSQAIAI